MIAAGDMETRELPAASLCLGFPPWCSVFLVAPGASLGVMGDTVQGVGGSGVGLPFRAEDMGKAGVLV